MKKQLITGAIVLALSATAGVSYSYFKVKKVERVQSVVATTEQVQLAPDSSSTPDENSDPTAENSKLSANIAIVPKTDEQRDSEIDQNTIKNVEQDDRIDTLDSRTSTLEDKINNPVPVTPPTPPVPPTPVVVGSLTLSSSQSNDPIVLVDGSATDQTLWEAFGKVETKDVEISSLNLRQIGSLPPAQFTNLRLYINGKQLARVNNLDPNSYANLSFDSVKLNVGSVNFKLVGDIGNGSIGFSASFSLRNKGDVKVNDVESGKAVEVGGTIPLSSGQRKTEENKTASVGVD